MTEGWAFHVRLCPRQEVLMGHSIRCRDLLHSRSILHRQLSQVFRIRLPVTHMIYIRFPFLIILIITQKPTLTPPWLIPEVEFT